MPRGFNKRLRPLTRYYGGKSDLFKWLEHLAPHQYPLMTCVDACLGAGSFLLNKKPSIIDIGSDLSPRMINIWQVIKEPLTYLRFTRIVRDIHHNRSQFLELQFATKSEDYADDNVYRAAIDLALCHLSHSGKGQSYSFCHDENTHKRHVNAWVNFKAMYLPKIHQRLQGCQIQYRSVFDLLDVFRNTGKTFFYIDPPYMPETRTSDVKYDVDWTVDDHKRLLASVINSKCKIMISGYNTPLYESTLTSAGWNVKTKVVDNKMGFGSGAVVNQRVEYLWRNFGV